MGLAARAAGVAALLAVAALPASTVACGAPAAAAPPASSPSGLLGKAAPEFARRPLGGDAKVDIAGARGRVVVVKFMARYCAPCKRTLPAVEAFHAAHPEVLVIGVAEDEHEAEARALVDEYKLTFPVIHDAQQVLGARYRVGELPVTFVLDGQGKVSWVGGPEKSEADLVAAIAAARP